MCVFEVEITARQQIVLIMFCARKQTLDHILGCSLHRHAHWPFFWKIRTGLSALALTPSEYMWLNSTCSYFTSEYLSYLSEYRFKPDQVIIKFHPSPQDPIHGTLDMEIVGPWVETILWEVPLMSLLSEAYFTIDNCDWTYDGQEGAKFTSSVIHLPMC